MNHIKSATAITAFIGACAMSALPLSAPIQGQQGFATMDQAAEAAERAIIAKTTTVEMAGVVYESNGKFYYTSPATSNDHDQFAIRVAFPAGAKLVALYHDHPEHIDNNHFSPPDVAVANQLHVISYVGVIGPNHILKYTPGKSEVYHAAGGDLADTNDLVSDGSVVAAL